MRNHVHIYPIAFSIQKNELLTTSYICDENPALVILNDIIETVELRHDNQTVINNSRMTATIEDSTPPITTITDINGKSYTDIKTFTSDIYTKGKLPEKYYGSISEGLI